MYESIYFTYKNISSKDFDVNYEIIITTIEDNYKINIGYKKEFQLETSGNGNISYYSSSKKTGNTRQLQLCVINKYDQPIQITDDIRMAISEWLLGSNMFLPIYFDQYANKDLCQYVNILDIEFNSYFNEIGYFVLNIQFLDDYLYTRPSLEIITNKDSINGKLVQIKNISNLGNEYICPYVEIENLEGEPHIKITNMNTNETVEINNMPLDSKIKLFNDVGIIDCNKDWDYSNFNFNWFRLKSGVNFIKIEGKCQVTFELSFPLMA